MTRLGQSVGNPRIANHMTSAERWTVDEDLERRGNIGKHVKYDENDSPHV